MAHVFANDVDFAMLNPMRRKGMKKFDRNLPLVSLTAPGKVEQNNAYANLKSLMSSTKAPKCLWDYCAIYVCVIRCLTVYLSFAAQDRTPYELVTGRAPDISEYVELEWYELLWDYDQDNFPANRCCLGCWLGVAHCAGQAICCYILPFSGEPIVC
jgi:hypothetical protein